MNGSMIIGILQLEAFLFILARIAGIFIQAPLFSARSFPASAKSAFAVWLSLLLWFVTPVSTQLPDNLLFFLLTLAAEVALGFLIGFICNLLFLVFQAAGEIMDMQMGLSVAQALDPVFGAVISIIGRLLFFTTLTLFVILDGHHMLLSAFHQSFTVIPAGKMANFISPNLAEQLIEVSGSIWLTAVKLSAPIVLLIFLADFTFGIVSRVAPQVNVFQLGFQVKPLLGLFGITLITPFLVKYLGQMIGLMGQEVTRLLIFIK